MTFGDYSRDEYITPLIGACEIAPHDLAVRVVSGRRHPEVRGISRLNNLALVPPVCASYLALRPCPQDSEPVWLARPSPYGSFIR